MRKRGEEEKRKKETREFLMKSRVKVPLSAAGMILSSCSLSLSLKCFHLEATPLSPSILFSSSLTLHPPTLFADKDTLDHSIDTQIDHIQVVAPEHTLVCMCYRLSFHMWPFTLVFSDIDLFVINKKRRIGEERGREGCWEERERRGREGRE